MFDVERFEAFASCTQAELVEMLPKLLRCYGYKKIIVAPKRYIYAEGEIDVGLVAHLDTVFKTTPTEIFHDPVEKVLWSPEGLGADDRAGISAICEILDTGLRPWVFFCCDEEPGGLGAQALAKDIKPRLRYLIEIDRSGSKDAVFYNCDNKKFSQYICSFGFEEDWGTFSDIYFLAPEWGIAAVNLSTGYYNEHSKIEHLYYRILEDTIDKVINMLKDNSKTRFKYIPVKYARCDFCGSTYQVNYYSNAEESFFACKHCYEGFIKDIWNARETIKN